MKMKKQLLIILLLLYSVSFLKGQGPDTIMDFNFRNTPFEIFCESLLRQTGVRMFYDESRLKNIVVNLVADSISVLSAIERVLEGTSLRVSVWNDNLVIIPGEKLISELPYYEPSIISSYTTEKRTSRITESEARYLTSHKPGTIQTITVGKPQAVTGKTKVRVLGRILDQETGEPLISVPIYIVETRTGAATDINGFFTIALSPGRYNAKIEYLGYLKERFILEVLSEGNFSISLKKGAILLQDVIVSGESRSNIQFKEAGLDQISVSNIKSLPRMMGESDILKVSGTLPGIISTGEGGAGFNVRGSNSDQNAFYINRIPVYNTSHLFGFFSAFNSDIIRDFSIYKGYIPVQFGGRLASVFNITTRQGNKKHFTAHGGISPISGNIVVEGPLKPDTVSFILSIRSTYSDWLLSRIRDTTISSSSANFNDISGGINWDIQKTQLSLFLYHSSDHFRLAEINDYKYANNGASLILSHTYSNSLRGEFALTGSLYDFSTIDKLEISSALEHSYEIGQYEARTDFRQILNDKNNLEYGADLNLYKLNRGTVLPYGEKSLLGKVPLGKERGIEAALFISDSYELNKWLNIDLGIRYSLFVPEGPSKVYTYSDGAPRDQRYISDTLIYLKNEPLRWYHEPDLRASMNIKTDENGSIKLMLNTMHQNLFMLNTTTAIAPNTQWKLADYHLAPSKSNQVSLGIFRSRPENGLEASLEVYYKKTYDYPEFKDGADFLKNPLVETSVLQGDQRAYGLELYIKRSRRKLEGWISYAFSRSVIKINGEHSWDKINNGEPFPSNYDIPNSLNAALSYHFNRRIILSSIFTWQTGKPVTYPESVFYINGSPYLNYSKRNAYRIPDYIRLDLSLTIEGNLRVDKPVHSSYIFNLYNAAGRMNPFSVYFNTENGKIKSYKYSIIGVPVFTATWQFKFGNYASD